MVWLRQASRLLGLEHYLLRPQNAGPRVSQHLAPVFRVMMLLLCEKSSVCLPSQVGTLSSYLLRGDVLLHWQGSRKSLCINQENT